MDDILENIIKNLTNLKEFTSTPGSGVTRLPFTNEAKKACDYLKKEMESIGLETRIDSTGAIIGKLKGEKDESILIGSHYDSVENGGAFDGIAGIVCGIEVVKIFLKQNIKPKYTLEVIGTNDEEGARFKSGFFSSKAMLGELDKNEIDKLHDKNGVTIYEAMKDYGLNPENISDAKRDIENIKAFIEIHIEQGRVLESHEKHIGIVDTIVGMKRGIITVTGREDHAGTTPMNIRFDAVEMASKIISNISDIARKYENSVATVGAINVIPNTINTIAKIVKFSLDIRSTNKNIVDCIFEEIIDISEGVVNKYKGSFSYENTLYVEPVDMNRDIRKYIEDSCNTRKISYEHINSGAGHDSLQIGKKIDTAMIFVPSKDGRSHCSEEFTDYNYLKEATLIAFDAINKIN